MKMNRWHWINGAILPLILLAGAARGADNLAQWPRMAVLELPAKAPAGLVEAPLPPEVLAAARADLADLRLVGPAGTPVPYVLRIDQGTSGQAISYRPQRLYNPVFVAGQTSSVTVDFGNHAARSRVDVDTPGTNFRRRVTVEASADGTAWQTLVKTAWLFRIAYAIGTYNKNTIALPDNDFRFLRLTVFNAPDDPEQLPIRDVLAWYVRSTAAPLADVPSRSVTTTENAKLKATEIEVDLGYENLPLAEVTPAFADANFLRRVEVLGRNARTRILTEPVENAPPRTREIEEPWNTLTIGSVYRLPAGAGQDSTSGLTLAADGPGRYLLLRIYNGDDAPLKFTGLKVRRYQKYLGFRPEAIGAYKLYLGNSAAVRPQYDLENYAARLRTEGLTTAALGPVVANPQFAVAVTTIPWSERYAWLLWVALLAVGAVLGILVLRQARSARQPE